MRFLRPHRRRLLVWLIALLAAAPLLALPGLLNSRGGGDSPFLLQRLHQLTTALADGHFPVRWMPDANYGDGYPFYNFYAPLSIYIAALFRLVGFSYVWAIKLAQLAGFIVAAAGAWRLGRRWLGTTAAGLLTAVAYTFAPFHLVNVYVRGDSLAEFWAMAFYPWLLLAADALLTAEPGQRVRPVVWLALFYGALILSHNISALIFSPFLLLFIFLRLLAARREGGLLWPAVGQRAGVTAVALLMGLGVAAWFFIPALAEQELAQLGPVTEGYFNYSNHFREGDLVQRAWLFDYDVAGGAAFRMGLVQALLALAGVATWLGRLVRRRAPVTAVALFTLITLVVSTLLMTPWSRPLWDTLPLLAFTQFPWRFLSVQALATALATGALVGGRARSGTWQVEDLAGRVPGRSRTWQVEDLAGRGTWQVEDLAGRGTWQVGVPGRSAHRRAAALLAAAALVVAGLARLPADSLRLTDADITPERLAQYEWFTANIGTTVSAEYLPPTVQPRPFSSSWLERGERNEVQVVDGALSAVELQMRRTHQQQWRITGGPDGATAVFPTLGWPGWEVTIDGTAASWTPAPGSGRIRVTLPPGEHDLTLRLRRTAVRLWAEWLSLIAGVVVLGLLWRSGGLRPSRSWGVILLMLLGVLAINRLRPEPMMPAGDLTWDFDQLGYLHHSSPLDFADGAQLSSYGFYYDREAWAPGEPFTIIVFGEGLADGALTIDLVTPATTRFAAAPPALSLNVFATAPGTITAEAILPAEMGAGLYIPRLRRAAPALTPSGQPRGDLYLRPFRVTSPEESSVPAESSLLAVRPLSVTPDQQGTVAVALQWLTARPLAANHNVTLRLVDDAGLPVPCPGHTATGLCQLDVQPGYGWRPTTTWPPGQWVSDQLALPVPAEWPEAGTFAIVTTLYEAGSGTPLLTRRLGEISVADGRWQFRENSPRFAQPAGLSGVGAMFIDETREEAPAPAMALIGFDQYRVEGDPASLQLTLYWRSQRAGLADYAYFIHLVDPVTGAIVAQQDGMPRNNSYPTSQWVAEEVVADPITLDLAGVPPGTYRLVGGLYRLAADGRPLRLTALDPEGQPLANNQVTLHETLIIGR